jgi:hypothetical protein
MPTSQGQRKTGDSNPAAHAANRLATDLQHLLGLVFLMAERVGLEPGPLRASLFSRQVSAPFRPRAPRTRNYTHA